MELIYISTLKSNTLPVDFYGVLVTGINKKETVHSDCHSQK